MENETTVFDLSNPNPNSYKLTIKETILYGIFKICAPIVGAIANIVGGNSIAARGYLAIGLLGYANNYSSKNIDLLSKQAVLETANFVSPMAINDGNLFGMQRAFVRPTTADGFRYNASEGAEVSVYNDEFRSVLDRILWDKYNSISGDSQGYVVEVISSGYNPFDNYDEQWQTTTYQLPLVVYALAVVPFGMLIVFIYKLLKLKL